MLKDNLGFQFVAASQTHTSVAGLELLTALIRLLDLIRAIRSEVCVKKIDYGFREEEHLLPLRRTSSRGVESKGGISAAEEQGERVCRCQGSHLLPGCARVQF